MIVQVNSSKFRLDEVDLGFATLLILSLQISNDFYLEDANTAENDVVFWTIE